VRPFASVLVANRGEIARRVFRSASAAGLRCIAVYADADEDSPFVVEADDAVRLPGGYLDAAAIIEAARRAGAEAVHPGYGFLSENAAFAAAVIDAGLVWIGPAPDVIAAMGDKLAAKRAAVSAGVPTLPSSDDPTDGAAVGYPLLVKAAAGGGGKGMRIVASEAELADAVAASRREAQAAFGDPTVFLERYVGRSRHVEIQILGDGFGNLVHLGERECSIQRRHQKILEESPSPVVDGDLRNAMGEAALRLAKAIGYQSAGTVEFLLDEDTGEFAFLEVNTRLQVEHPVTEMVTGVDLVREQLRVAAGERLGFDQGSVSFSGHAVEVRLYAEDPASGFLPSSGRLAAFVPAAEPAVRWDSGVEQGSVVGLEFDPMLAKVVAHAPTRSEAAGRLALALSRLHLGGVATNRDFLVATLRSEAFLAGDTTTDFIERVAPATRLELGDDELDRALVAAALWVQGRNRAEASVLDTIPSGWRNGRLPSQSATLELDRVRHTVHYESRRDGSFAVSLGAGRDRGLARVHRWSPQLIDLELDGRRHVHAVTLDGDDLYVQVPSGTLALSMVPRFAAPASDERAGALVSPMPGEVLDLRVEVGQSVTAGDVLVVLEAMKMEHHMRASADGVVAEVGIAVGEQVGMGDLLLVLAPHEDADQSGGPPPGAPAGTE
jgi:propionyl-CoA carboxylase alpha chain